MLALIDYGLIVVFFVGLIVLVLMIAQQRPEAATAQKSVAARTSMDIEDTQQNKLSYGFLAALFILLLVVTVLAERGHTRAGSS